jgi:glutamate transport system permease protein
VHTLLEHSDELRHGVLTTVELTGVSYAGAMLIGILVAVSRISPVLPLRAAGAVYVTVIRNIPLLVLLVLVTFGLPEVGVIYGSGQGPLFWTVSTAMALYGAAYVAEVIRCGVLTVPAGQAEAARAIGLTFTQCLRHVILPQALRSMVQPLGGIFIAVALNTSLAAFVGIDEVTQLTRVFTNSYDAEPIGVFLVAAAFYVAIALAGGLLTGAVERMAAITR